MRVVASYGDYKCCASKPYEKIPLFSDSLGFQKTFFFSFFLSEPGVVWSLYRFSSVVFVAGSQHHHSY